MISDQLRGHPLFVKVVVLLILITTGLCDLRAAPADDSASAWRIESAPCRISFRRGEKSFILTELPFSVSNRCVSTVSAWNGKNKLKCGIIFNDGENIKVLVDASSAVENDEVNLYLIPGDKPAVPSESLLKEPEPLHGKVGRTAGMDYPRTRSEADSLITRFDSVRKTFSVPEFDQLGSTFEDWFKGNWRRKNHLVDLQSWIFVPEDNKYIFGVSGSSPAWLDVDGTQLAEHPAYLPPDEWTAGDPVQLETGLHCIQLRTVCRKKIDTGLAWKREGEDGSADDVVMITGVDLTRGRMEWSCRSVHPFFTWTTGQTYRFSGIDSVFVPCSLKNRSVCWSGRYDLEWNVAGVSSGQGGKVETTLASADLPAEVRLTVTATKDGESETYTEILDYNGPLWSEYDITSRISGLNAACYGKDKIHPVVRIRTSAADGLVYTLDSTIELLSGKRLEKSEKKKTHHGWARSYLSELTAGAVKTISWSVKHCGCELTSGRVLFQRDPFEIVPDKVSGDLFKYGNDFMVMVVSGRSAEREVTTFSPDSGNGVMFLDGFVFENRKRSVVNPDTMKPDADWIRLSVSDLEENPLRSGTAALQSFTKISEALNSDTVIYAPSLDCIASEGGTDGFERRLAAMCGLLTHSRENSPRVILVVPPPFEKFPGAGELSDASSAASPVDARQVAEIILRVADVYGVETVDLYTAFEITEKSADEDLNLLDGYDLTAAGRELARSIIKRKM
ncbi:MAG: hypothetical protein R6V06_01385 [Kiritimatiellia bacterium]